VLDVALADLPIDAYDNAIATTLRSVFVSMKYEIPAMLKAGGGAIVNMSSTAGLEAVGGLAGYVSAKHGVIGLTKNGGARVREPRHPCERSRTWANSH
jgi:NAD(P)-dependent dehydrogenase (short-subunit alcohol dehydrogenase family)